MTVRADMIEGTLRFEDHVAVKFSTEFWEFELDGEKQTDHNLSVQGSQYVDDEHHAAAVAFVSDLMQWGERHEYGEDLE